MSASSNPIQSAAPQASSALHVPTCVAKAMSRWIDKTQLVYRKITRLLSSSCRWKKNKHWTTTNERNRRVSSERRNESHACATRHYSSRRWRRRCSRQEGQSWEESGFHSTQSRSQQQRHRWFALSAVGSEHSFCASRTTENELPESIPNPDHSRRSSRSLRSFRVAVFFSRPLMFPSVTTKCQRHLILWWIVKAILCQ